MTELLSLKILIGDKHRAIHQVAAGMFSTVIDGAFVRASFECKDDDATFESEIKDVTIETTGNITREEILIAMRRFAREMHGRIGQAAEYYLKKSTLKSPTSEEIRKGLSSIAKNNLKALA